MIKPHCIYSPADFTIGKLLRKSIFDTTLLSSWKSAENIDALNYKVNECNIISKTVNVNKCNFQVTLNEKRFSKRRSPQEMTSLNQSFDCSKFNFTKVMEREILMTIANFQVKLRSQNVIIVNASPFQEGHSLLVPELDSCHNQVMRESPLRTALDTILISGENNFTVAFNSLLACASVNHLHFHLWVNDQPLLSSLLDLEPLVHVDRHGQVFHMTDHPVHNLVIPFTNMDSLDSDFKLFWTLVTVLQRLQVPHSICYLKSAEGLRGVIWPRRVEADNSLKMCLNGSQDVVNVAAAELAGQIFTGDKHLFSNNLDSDLLDRSFRRVNLSEEEWTGVVLAIQSCINEK